VAHRLCALAAYGLLPALLLACGGPGGEEPAGSTPGPAAPRNVIAFGAEENGAHGLYLVAPDGTQRRRLSDEPGPVAFARWSPDGERLAYAVERPGGEGNASLRIYDFERGLTTTASSDALASDDGYTAAWSPDGERLAFVQSGGVLAIYDLAAHTAAVTAIPATAVDWSSLDTLVIARPADGASDLFAVEIETTALTPLLDHEGIEGGPAWSREGDVLAFWSAPSAALSERRLLTLERGAEEPVDLDAGFDAAWSPDGARLAYVRAVTAGARRDLDVYVWTLGDGEPARLSRSVTLDRHPSWSPAGDAVVYLAPADESTAFLCIATLEPEGRDCLDLPGLLPGAPAWSPY
jgi:Tol biopolymer transport system component